MEFIINMRFLIFTLAVIFGNIFGANSGLLTDDMAEVNSILSSNILKHHYRIDVVDCELFCFKDGEEICYLYINEELGEISHKHSNGLNIVTVKYSNEILKQMNQIDADIIYPKSLRGDTSKEVIEMISSIEKSSSTEIACEIFFKGSDTLGKKLLSLILTTIKTCN